MEINGFDTTSQALDERLLVRIGSIDHPVETLDLVKTEPISSTDWGHDDLVIGVEITNSIYLIG